MTSGLETLAGRAAGRVLARWSERALEKRRAERLAESLRPLVATRVADQTIEELAPDQVSRLSAYLDSPDFEYLAMQLVLTLSTKDQDEALTAVREQLRHGLRHTVRLPADLLYGITDVVLDALVAACPEDIVLLIKRATLTMAPFAGQGFLAAMAARNGRLLARVKDLSAIHELATRLRAQIVALHADLRLPHTGTSRSAPWTQLYVTPTLRSERESDDAALPPDQFTEPGRRTVILGDPGAGKSTLATKLAYDVASGDRSQVPFLVVLRDLSSALQQGERSLAEHLAVVARAPYNVELSADAVEYLLLNGRAVVILDGLDELTDIALRRRVVDLVEGFVALYPLVPVVATSRRVGYLDAPLSRRLFDTCLIAPFDGDQVQAYAGNWFALDDGTPITDREQLRGSFLRESRSIADLRSNPLLLALLCAMYAAEQYIPRNRAQVYERCAVMVFERWDSMRGVPMPLPFHGHVRGAVQELAWHMFATSDVSELPRHRVVRVLVDYLRSKRFDDDEARALAEKFLSFCAGRAWVLAEVGATETEPIYGFAHRTFLEYFAADRLVRHNPSPEAVWTILASHIEDPTWTVVGQLALQLLDRNMDDGAESLLALAMDSYPAGSFAVAAFLARATTQVVFSPASIKRIVDIAVDCARTDGLDVRHRFFTGSAAFNRSKLTDDPLYMLCYESLDANLPYVRRSLQARLAADIEAGDELALFLADCTGRRRIDAPPERSELWLAVRNELADHHRDEVQAPVSVGPWLHAALADIRSPTYLEDMVDRFGPAPVYKGRLYCAMATWPVVINLLSPSDETTPEGMNRLRDLLVDRPAPWLPADRWLAEWRETMQHQDGPWELDRLLENAWPNAGAELAAYLVIFLPYAETYADEGLSFSVPVHPALDALMLSRVRGELENWEALDSLPERYRDFLARWARREFSVIG